MSASGASMIQPGECRCCNRWGTPLVSGISLRQTTRRTRGLARGLEEHVVPIERTLIDVRIKGPCHGITWVAAAHSHLGVGGEDMSQLLRRVRTCDRMTGTYLINLARSTDRKAHMVKQFAMTGRPFDVIEGVEGRDLDLSKPEFHVSIKRDLIPYAIGCALSHSKAYQKALDDGIDVALILEDDVLLPADLNELVEAVEQHMAGAEVVLLQVHSCTLTMTFAEQLPGGRKLVQLVDDATPHSAAAYLITREACERMLKIMGPPIRTVADDWTTFYHEGALDRVRCVIPMPVQASIEFPTTRDNLPPGSIAAFLVDGVNRLKIPVFYQLLRSRRKRWFNHLFSSVDFVPIDCADNAPLLARAYVSDHEPGEGQEVCNGTGEEHD